MSGLINVSLCMIDYSCVSEVVCGVKVAYRLSSKGKQFITDQITDSILVKVRKDERA